MLEVLKNIPESPGVYLMKDSKGKIIYIGKAVNLKRRVLSYFQKAHDSRIEKMVSEIKDIEFKITNSALEALILESNLIKKNSPKYNIKEKDDKSFLYIKISKEKFPRVFLIRGKDLKKTQGTFFGPFTQSGSLKEALNILRKIFPFANHEPYNSNSKKLPKACFDFQIYLCPGTCVNAITSRDYKKNIVNLKLFLQGKRDRIIKSLKKEMDQFSKKMEFEKAENIKRKIFALNHIQDIALIKEDEISTGENSNQFRIEGYDISNISGTSAVGSMVVFINGKPNKAEYRKFKIKTIQGPNDTGMLKEVLFRRFKNDWRLPNLILIDGGLPQINSAREVLEDLKLNIPLVGIAKGPDRDRNDFIGNIPEGVEKKVLIQVRDEAHRFAIKFHKELRAKNTFK
ncbi:MAG: excinuclease ABC subunit UvrC [Candidatus Pacebacteria bacterium]|nr:excinuclease ABC subunit UvrC [Candidatus Paceibacterota bacterium]